MIIMRSVIKTKKYEIKRGREITKEYKGRADRNNHTRPNEAVRVATLLLNIYLIETKGQQGLGW